MTKTHTDLLAHTKAAELFDKARADVASAQEAFRKESTASSAMSITENEARAAFEMAEQALANAQALHLATKLEVDEPCPVCGSTDHPNPATGDIENAGLDQAFRDARDRLLLAERAARKAGEKLAGFKATLAAREERLSSLEQPPETLATIADTVRQTEFDLEALGPVENLEEAGATIEALDKHITEREAESERLRNEFEECRNTATEAKATRDGKLTEVPEELRVENALASALAEALSTLETLIGARKEAEELVSATRDAAVSADAALKGATDSLSVYKTRHKKADDAFCMRLSEQGLTHELYQSLKPSIATINSDNAAVKTFETQLNEAQKMLPPRLLAI